MCVPIKIKNVMIGEGKPKICIPVTGTTKQEIIRETEKIKNYPADIIEWRADAFQSYRDTNEDMLILEKIHEICPEKPLILTLRTIGDGGNADISSKDYAEWMKAFYACPYIDMVDVELNHDCDAVNKITEQLHKNGKIVISSYHDFKGTPDTEEMMELFRKMDTTGADILKLAVMPDNRKDVMDLLNVTVDMASMTHKPLITMSMGKAGVLSRLIGEMTGSVITFAVGEKASAPGQISAGVLEQILDLLHDL